MNLSGIMKKEREILEKIFPLYIDKIPKLKKEEQLQLQLAPTVMQKKGVNWSNYIQTKSYQ